jgi:preprotein translocase subunit SecA
MAGRGVDILLGGNPEGLARQKLRAQGIEVTQATPEQWQEALAQAKAETEADRQVVLAAGGLFVLGTERHEARRIDNQLRGRAGRQGDPGESRFYLSLEDDLMRRFGGDRVKNFMSWAKIPENEPIEHSMVSKSIAQAQVRVEGHNFDIRKRVLEYDDVVNKQRSVIYAQRRELLSRADLRDEYLKIIEEGIAGVIEEFEQNDSGDIEALYRQLFTIFPVPEQITPEVMANLTLDELEDRLIEAVSEVYDAKTAELGDLMPRAERMVMLNAVDQYWRRHLTDLDVLREGIGLMSIAQRDPLVEYKREAFRMWEDMQDQIRAQAARDIFRVQVSMPQVQSPVRRPVAQVQATHGGAAADTKPEPVRKDSKAELGRNDPCWCGSGKKYKHCHMRTDRKMD